MFLTRVVRSFIGLYTQTNQNIMRDFKPKGYQQLLTTLKLLQQKKQFIQLSGTADAFIQKAEKQILRQKWSTRQILHIYHMMKKLQMVDASFRHAVFSKFHQKLTNFEQQIGNQDTESLLWWMLHQCPYRYNHFIQAAQMNTLKLFQIHEYMNDLKVLPYYQPYIRVTYLLKHLGHQVQIRKQLFQIQQIEKIPYRFLPAISQLTSSQEAAKYAKDQSLYTHFKNNLARIYLNKGKAEYDYYLHRVQQIDNHGPGQQIDRTFDVIFWDQLANLTKVVEDSLYQQQFDMDLQYQFQQVFWRKLQTQNVSFQYGAKILEIFCRFQPDQATYKMINRILDAMLAAPHEQIFFASYSCLNSVLKNVGKLKFRDHFIKDFKQKMKGSLDKIIEWDNADDKQQFKDLLESYDSLNQII